MTGFTKGKFRVGMIGLTNEGQRPADRNSGDSNTLAEISQKLLGYREGRNEDLFSRVGYLLTVEKRVQETGGGAAVNSNRVQA